MQSLAAVLLRAGVCCVALGQTGCTPSPGDSPAERGESLHELAIAYLGCAQVFLDGKCALGSDGEISLWIGTLDPRTIDISLGTRRIDLATEATIRESGMALRLKPAAFPTTLRVRGTAPGTIAFELAIDRSPAYSWLGDVEAALARNDVATAISLLISADGQASEAERGPLLSWRARARMRAQDWAAAQRDFDAAIAAHLAQGRVSAVVSDLTTVAFFQLNQRGDLVAAMQSLARVPTPVRGDARAQSLIENTQGFAARLAGDLSSAERHYRNALRSTLRVGDSLNAAAARAGLAQTWAEMGLFARALDLLNATPAESMQRLAPCNRARLHNSRAWIELLAAEAGEPIGDPMPELALAADLLGQQCAHAVSDRSNVEINRALALIQRGDAPAARRALQDARTLNAEAPAQQRAWQLEIEARIALLEARPAVALAIFRELDRRADALMLFDVQWRAALGAAQALRALGSIDDEIAELERADRLLVEYVRDLPVSDSRALFLARYESLPRQLVQALLDRERTDEAFMVARRYRNEPLRQVQRMARIDAFDAPARARWIDLVSQYQQVRTRLDEAAAADWQLSAEQLLGERQSRERDRQQLRALVEQAAALGSDRDALPDLGAGAADDLDLLFFPLTRGWAAFAASHQGLRVVRIASLRLTAPQTELTRDLLEPFRGELTHSSRLRVMAYGPLRDLDFHRLEWNGQPLAASMSVVYAADLPPLTTADARTARALLVADPSGDLPAARLEVAAIARGLLQTRPRMQVDRLQGTAATAAAIRKALTDATLFHYAGHTARAQDAEASIGLALVDGQRLELGDILMLPQAPQLAVLAACDSAQSNLRLPAEALSLAHAFLVRGSLDVIATTRAVDDGDSAQLTAILHSLLADGVPADRALGEAQRRLLAAQPRSDWSAYRLYTR